MKLSKYTKMVPVSTLSANTFVTKDCRSERGELLIAAGTKITTALIQRLSARNVFEVYQEEDPSEKSNSQTAGNSAKISENDLISLDFANLSREPQSTLLGLPIITHLDENLAIHLLTGKPAGHREDWLAQSGPISMQSQAHKAELMVQYHAQLDAIREFFNDILKGKQVDAEPLRTIADTVLKLFIRDRDILLQLAITTVTSEEYVFGHTLNSCSLSICIAAASGYNRHQVTMVGMGALLFDIGMLLVSREIREKNSHLDEREFMEIRKHPVVGLLILDRIKNIPDPVKYMMYQSHERENGTGYPRQRQGTLIHKFAKIIQVADIFEALTSPRTHRAAYTPFESVEMLIRMTQKGLLAQSFVKAFLSVTSLFPVGSIVELSDHRFGRVVRANLSQFHRPVVRIITDAKGNIIPPESFETIPLVLNEDLSIIRAFAPTFFPEVNPLEGF